jgi:hypothetical protein
MMLLSISCTNDVQTIFGKLVPITPRVKLHEGSIGYLAICVVIHNDTEWGCATSKCTKKISKQAFETHLGVRPHGRFEK